MAVKDHQGKTDACGVASSRRVVEHDLVHLVVGEGFTRLVRAIPSLRTAGRRQEVTAKLHASRGGRNWHVVGVRRCLAGAGSQNWSGIFGDEGNAKALLYQSKMCEAGSGGWSCFFSLERSEKATTQRTLPVQTETCSPTDREGFRWDRSGTAVESAELCSCSRS